MANCAKLKLSIDGVDVTIKSEAPPAEGGEVAAFDFGRLLKIGLCVAGCIAGAAPSIPPAGAAAPPAGAMPATRPAR